MLRKYLNNAICGPWHRAEIIANPDATRQRKLHPRVKDPSLNKYFVTKIQYS